MWCLPLLRTLRMSLSAVLTMPSPRAIGLAVAMGTAVGMVPKGNLIAVLLGVVMCSLRLNLVVALGTAVLISLVAVEFDPLFDLVGYAVLTWEPLRPTWVWCANQPFASWTQFHNSVVMGSLLVGLAQIAPTFWVARQTARKLIPNVVAILAASRLLKMWRRLEWTTRLTHASDA